MGTHWCSHYIQILRFVHGRSEAEYVGNGVIDKFLDEMRRGAYGAVVNFVIVLWMVEAGHGMVFHSLWPQEKWVHLGCGRGLCSASTLNPLAQLLHLSF
jgi:hypothetical protein